MKWIAVAGSWRKTNSQIKEDILKTVDEIISAGNGIVSGGALGVDYIATERTLELDGKLKIIIPSTLETYENHYSKRAQEGVITKDQADALLSQLKEVKKRGSLIEGNEDVLNKETYYNRITKIIENADELVAFHVNKSEGTQDTINKAEKKGIPIKIFNYTLE
ncbi:MAG: DNA-protecting protein DprA [Burkholderiales bacterium]|nr:DNA-protecting protein DprA [Burkholderiales bacterium]